MLLQKFWLCFRACNSRIVTYDQEFCRVVWFLCFNHCYGIFWKVFLKEIMVLSKTCVRFWNRIFKRFEWISDQIIFLPWLLGKKICSPLWKEFENFSILGVDFFLFKKVKLLYFGRVTFASNLSKGLNVLAIFRYVVKIEVFSEGKTRKNFSASGIAFERLTFLSKVENRLKRGENLCENFTRRGILDFKKCLNDGNLWFLPFSFQWLLGHTFL